MWNWDDFFHEKVKIDQTTCFFPEYFIATVFTFYNYWRYTIVGPCGSVFCLFTHRFNVLLAKTVVLNNSPQLCQEDVHVCIFNWQRMQKEQGIPSLYCQSQASQYVKGRFVHQFIFSRHATASRGLKLIWYSGDFKQSFVQMPNMMY